jgi:hypothetical protein
VVRAFRHEVMLLSGCDERGQQRASKHIPVDNLQNSVALSQI